MQLSHIWKMQTEHHMFFNLSIDILDIREEGNIFKYRYFLIC